LKLADEKRTESRARARARIRLGREERGIPLLNSLIVLVIVLVLVLDL
jgi:hypothetical protein